MIESPKIDFRARRINQLADVTDLVDLLFPGNRNQQHAAARILLHLKTAPDLVPNLSVLERQFGISRRTLQRTRAKLARLDLIEWISWMNSRHGGQQSWKLSGRMSTALRHLADKIDQWRNDRSLRRCAKEDMLADCLRQ